MKNKTFIYSVLLILSLLLSACSPGKVKPNDIPTPFPTAIPVVEDNRPFEYVYPYLFGDGNIDHFKIVDEETIMSSSEDSDELLLWDISTGERKGSIQTEMKVIQNFAVDHDNEKIVLVGEAEYENKAGNNLTQPSIKIMKFDGTELYSNFSREIDFCMLSDTEKFYSVEKYMSINEWNFDDEKFPYESISREFQEVMRISSSNSAYEYTFNYDWSSDCKWFVVFDAKLNGEDYYKEYNNVYIANIFANDEDMRGEMLKDQSEPVKSGAFSPDVKQLALAESIGKITLFNIGDLENSTDTFQFSKKAILHLIWTPDSENIIFIDEAMNIVMFNRQSGEVINQVQFPEKIREIQWSIDGNTLWINTEAGDLIGWPVNNLNQVGE